MTDSELLKLAGELGFDASLIPAVEIPVNAEFRRYCEENRCGQYNRNESCPPRSGTPEELHDRLLSHQTALVLLTKWELESYSDGAAIRRGKNTHNTNALRLMDALRADGHSAVYAGCSCCSLCEKCAAPCPHPESRFSCVSAYCVDVAELAKRCNLPFDWDSHRLYCYSLIAFN